MPKRYLPKFKHQVVLSIQNGLPIKESCQRHQVAQSTIYRWVKEHKQTDFDLSIIDYTTLQLKSQRLDHILQIIRLSAIVGDVPLQKRLAILALLHE